MCGKSRQPSPSRRPAGIDKRGMAWNHVLLIHTDAKEPDVKAIVLSVFLGGLAVCVLTGASVLWALLLGLACFAGYALRQGHAPRDVALMLWSGVRSVRNILIIFGLIGMLTAVWRASGTLPFIIHHTLQWVDLLLLHPVGLPPVLPAEPPARHGVRLGQHPRRHFYDAGPFRRAGRACHRRGYHERHLRRGQMLTRIIQCGARLCAHEYQYIREYAPHVDNLGTPLRPDLRGLSGAVPLRPGAARGTGRRRTDGPFFHSQRLDALARRLYRRPEPVPRRRETGHVLEHPRGGRRLPDRTGHGARELFACLAFGYTPAHGAEILAGGGIRSMLQVAGIVLLSSSYSGIFDVTDLLSGFGGLIRRLAERIGTFRAMTLASVPVSGISCNQTLATILTAQLCRPCYARRQDMAIPLEKQRHPHSRADPVEHRRQPPLRHARRDDGLPPVCVVFVPCPAGERAAQRPRPRRARTRHLHLTVPPDGSGWSLRLEIPFGGSASPSRSGLPVPAARVRVARPRFSNAESLHP